MVSKEYVPKDLSLVVLTSPPKWLNLVLDINGILCHCMEKVATNGMPYVNNVKGGIHSSMVLTIVGPKVVFMHPRLLEFFISFSNFIACVFIWSLMKRFIVRELVNYLFCSLPFLFEILR